MWPSYQTSSRSSNQVMLEQVSTSHVEGFHTPQGLRHGEGRRHVVQRADITYLSEGEAYVEIVLDKYDCKYIMFEDRRWRTRHFGR
jgi:hypothetical protein